MIQILQILGAFQQAVVAGDHQNFRSVLFQIIRNRVGLILFRNGEPRMGDPQFFISLLAFTEIFTVSVQMEHHSGVMKRPPAAPPMVAPIMTL